jgi:hypothetical protein
MKGYRTIVLNLVAMVGMLITLLTGTETKDEVTTIQEHALLILESGIVAWGILAVWVRRMTDTPMGMGKEVAYRPGKRR